jgi:hypothetical protein
MAAPLNALHMKTSNSCKNQASQNQIQSRGYRSHNRSEYRPAKPLQPYPFALRIIAPDTIFPDAPVSPAKDKGFRSTLLTESKNPSRV